MALKDFQNYLASQGGDGAEQYIDPTSGKIKTEATGGALGTAPTTLASSGFDFGAANNLSAGNLKNPGAIAPGLGMVNKFTTDTGSAWSTAKEKTSMGVAAATGNEYVPYTQQAQNKVTTPAPTTPVATEPTVTSPTTQPAVSTPTVNTAPTTTIAPTTTTPATTPVTTPTEALGGVGGAGMAGSAVWTAPTLASATDMRDYINEMYAKQQESQLAALESSYNQQMAALDAAAGNIPQQYYEAGRQQAGQNALDTKAMNERLMASGLNTGAAGQAALAQNAVNQGNMARIRQAEADALAEVEQQRASTSIAYQDAIKEAILNNDTQKALALYQEAQRVDQSMLDTALKQAELDAMEYEYQLEADKLAQERADKKAAQELEALQQRAATMASIGDFSLYEYLGYTPEQIAALGNAYTAANTKSGGGNYIAPQQEETPNSQSGSQTSPLTNAQAMSIFGAVQKGYMDKDSALYAIEGALNAGTMSATEADYILSYMGV